MKNHPTLRKSASLVACLVTTHSTVHAADGVWDGGGNSAIWGGFNNWNPNGVIATGTDATATFASAFGNGRTILLNTSRTLGQVIYTDPGTETAMTLSWHNNNPTSVITLNTTSGSPSFDVAQEDRTLTVTARLGGTKGFTKTGPGTMILDIPGSAPNHTLSGSVGVGQGILSLAEGQVLANATLDTAGSVAGDAANGLRTTVTDLSFAGLSGDKDLASIFTTDAGGFDTLTTLTLSPSAGAEPAYSGGIADGATGMNLIKTGDGTQTLAGSCTHTGSTSVDAGRLNFSTSTNFNSGVTVAATAGILVTAADTQWASTSDFALLDNSTLAIDFGSSAPSTTVAPMLVDDFTPGANVTVAIAADPASSLTAGQSFPLVSWTGAGPTDTSAFATLQLAHRVEGNLSVVGNSLVLNITSNTAEPIAWNTGDGTWDTSTANWLDVSSTPTTYVDPLDEVIFGDAAGVTGDPVVTIGSGLSPIGVTMNSTSHDYILSGAGGIDGSGPLTLDPANTRTLTIATGNSFSGDVLIGGGTLEAEITAAGGFTALGAPSNARTIAVESGATLRFNVANVFSGNFSSTDVPTLVVNGGTVTNANPLALPNGVNNALNDVTLNGGNLDATVGQANGYAAWNINGTVTSTGSSLISSSEPVFGTIMLNSTGAGGVATTTTMNVQDGTLTISAPLVEGTADGKVSSLTKSGDGTLVLDAATSYTGTTNLAAGTLRLGAAERIPDGPGVGNLTVDGTLDLNGFSESVNGLSGSGVIDSSAPGAITLSVGGDNAGGTFSGILQNTAGTLSLVKTGTATLVLSGENTLGGTVAVDAGTLALGNVNPLADVAGITLADGTTLRPDVVGAAISAPVTLGGAGTSVIINAPTVVGAGGTTPVPFTLNGAIGGDGDVTFRGTQGNNAYGTVVLNAAGTYTGDTLVTCSGNNTQIAVFLGIDNALPTGTVLTLDGGNGAGSGRRASLDLKGFNQTLAGLTNVTRNLRTQHVYNTAPAAATLTINNSGDFTYSGEFGGNAGNGNFAVAKSGPGLLVLSGELGYTGDTTANGGILSLGNANGLNDASAVTIASGAKLELAFAGTDEIGALVIGGLAQEPGVYGHTDSGADNGGQGVGFFDTFFEPGTGTLTVTAIGGYASWAADNAPITGGDPNADEDGDGVGNAVEYVLGGTIATNDLDKLPTLSTSGGNLVFSFLRDQQSIDGTTVATIEAGTTLADWPESYAVPDDAAANDPGVTVVKDSPESGVDTVTLTLPVGADPKKFARLNVQIAIP